MNTAPSVPATRREFLAQSTLAATGLGLGVGPLAATAASAIDGPKVRIGFIGIGNRGSQLMHLFMAQPDVEVVALCDVYEPYRTRDASKVHPRYRKELAGQVPALGEPFGAAVTRHNDYRELLDRKDVDAVCIATPDHWHALQTIDAIRAGKDVYVEKPLSITIAEGRRMVQAQAASKQVVAVGLNRRGSPVYQKLAREVAAGKLGKVTVARAARVSNMFPRGIGREQPAEPPPGLDWDAWLGPRAFRPYQFNIAPYKFRWWSDYSSQMGNWGVHYLDVIRWMLGEQAPVAVTAAGGRYGVDDDRDIPDTMEVTFEFASKALATFSIHEAAGGTPFPYGEVELCGAKGTLHAGEGGYRITPAVKGQFQSWEPMLAPEQSDGARATLPDGSGRDSTANLVRNFLDCVRSREVPLCPLEEGHRSTCFAHLANIALKLGRRLVWDPQAEQFTNCPEANELLHYPYRKPWSLG